ncbi:hypothetical protein QBC38DRAFT_502567 [Podospora fimiseda]|uniref:IBR domain-containing protein n=1 Tax=Podospora fimiseda TaxID=252190 RepID=A0AAN7BIX6_9PEZI|nr:hypothetical protein QBC38DRAFT_502567 [Podospora fimiseda]
MFVVPRSHELSDFWDLEIRKFHKLIKETSMYQCLVHLEDEPCATDAPPTPGCNHDQNVCNACMRTDMEGKIRSGKLQNLTCLDPYCMKPLPVHKVRKLIGPECLKIYDRKLAVLAISIAPNFRWCRCGSGQIHGLGDSSSEWICVDPQCRRQNCYTCNTIGLIDCPHLRAINEKRRAHRAEMRRLPQVAFEQKQMEILEDKP